MVYFTDREWIWKIDHMMLRVCLRRTTMKLLFSVLLACTAAGAGIDAHLPFIQDNFPKARAQALQRQLPIFVECWAPW
jgi:hypothetical protein